MQKEELEKAQQVLSQQPETMVLLPTGEGKQVSVHGAHLVSKKLLGVLAHILKTFRSDDIELDLAEGKTGSGPNDLIPWGVNTINFRTDAKFDDFARFNPDHQVITLNLKALSDFSIEQVQTDTKDSVHGVMSLNGMYWWLCLDSLLHDLFHAWSVNIDRDLVEGDKETNEKQASDWATKALIKLAEEVDIEQPALSDEPWFGIQAWVMMLNAIANGEEWAARQQRLIDGNLVWGKEGATSEMDERMQSFRDYVRTQMAKVDEPWDANVTQIELIENGTGLKMSEMVPTTDVNEDAEKAMKPADLDIKAANATMPDIETEDLELMGMPEPEGAGEGEIVEELPAAEEITEVEKPAYQPTDEVVEGDDEPAPAIKTAYVEHAEKVAAGLNPDGVVLEEAKPEVVVPNAVITAEGEAYDLDDAMSIPDVDYQMEDVPEMGPPATTAAPAGPALAAQPATLGEAPLTASSNIQLEDPGLTGPQYEEVILGIYDLLSRNIYEKCGWQKVADPAAANSPVDFCTLTDAHAVLQPVSLASILSKVPGSEKILLTMDTLTAEGRWAPDTPVQNMMVKGQVFKNSGLPGYTLTFNFAGTKIKRSIVPQNPNKKYDDGNLKPTAIAARQGSAVCWIMDGARNVSKFYYKWNNGALEKLN